MRVWINQKSIGKRKTIRQVPLEYENVPGDVRSLIEETVRIMVDAFLLRQKNKKETPLSDEEITDLADIGKISFGILNNDNRPNLEEAKKTALLAFQDGLVCIFLNDERIKVPTENLGGPTPEDMEKMRIELHEGDRLTFVRLTMLAGRMW